MSYKARFLNESARFCLNLSGNPEVECIAKGKNGINYNLRLCPSTCCVWLADWKISTGPGKNGGHGKLL